ncbi:MAG: hypothetical protein WB623_19715 [Candidatus Sulfotelmatobacter sp.]|jgi:hypothetical protein
MHFLSEMEVDPDGPQNQVEHPNGESIELSPQSREQLVLEWIVPIIAVVLLVAFIMSAAALLLGDQPIQPHIFR